MTFLRTLFIFFFLSGLSLFGADEITLRLKWYNQFQFAGYYMAKEKGFYDKAGLHVTIQEVNPKESYLTFLKNTPSGYAIMGASGILQRLRGEPIVTLGAIFQQAPNIFIALKESGIKDLSDIKGRRVMANLDENDAPNLIALQESGLSKNDFLLQAFSFDYNDLLSGKTDVMSAYITDTPFSLQKKGIAFNVIDPLAYGVNFYGDMIYTSEEEILQNPERAKKFLEASIQGWEYALKNTEETIDVISRIYHSKLSKEHLAYEAMMSKQMIMAERIPIGQISESRIKEIAQHYVKLGLASNTDKIKNFVFGQRKKDFLGNKFETMLTKEEKAYVKEKSPFLIGFIQEYPPFSYLNEKGEYAGIILDIINAIDEFSGLKLTAKPLPWTEVMKSIQNRSIDLYFGQETEERRAFATFTTPVSSFSYAAFSHNPTNRAHSFEALKNKKVMTLNGFAINEALKAIPGIELIYKKNTLEALESLMRQEADYFIDNILATNYYIKTFSLTGIYLSGIVHDKEQLTKLGIRNDDPLLFSIIQKAVKAIPKERLEAIQQHWILNEFNKSEKKNILISPEEKEWISRHPLIRVANDPAYPPFDFTENDKAMGFSIELFEEICKIIGISPLFITQEWESATKAFEKGSLDVLTSVMPTNENSKFTIYSKPYAQNVEAVVLSKNHPDISTMSDLQNKRLAMPSGYENIAKLRESGLQFEHIASLDPLDSLRLVLTNKADYTIEALPVIDYYATKYGISNIKINSLPPIGDYNHHSRNFHFAFHSHDTTLKVLVDKALDTMSKDEILKLQRKWFTTLNNESTIPLTDEERQWLLEHPTLSIANDSDWAPYDFTQNGKPIGYSVDLFNLIGKKLGIRVNFVQAHTWSELLETFKNKKIDIIHASAKTPEREKYTLFGSAYIVTQTVLVHPKGSKNFKNLEEALQRNNKIALAKGYWTEEAIKNAFPAISIETYESTLEALKAVSEGKTALFIGTEKPIRYLANLYQIQNLELTPISFFSKSEYEKLYFGVQKENTILHSILQKTFAHLPNDEVLTLQKKWFGDVLTNDTAIKIKLNESELNYLKQHPILKVGAEAFYPPYDFVDSNGLHKGLSHDTLHAIFKEIKNINLEKVIQSDWTDNVKKLQNGEIDLILSATSKIHNDDIILSVPYLSVPYMIFGTKNSMFTESLAELANKKVGYLEKGLDITYLQTTYPKVHFTSYASVKDLLNAVNTGSLEYFLSNIPSINNSIKEQRLLDIKLLGKTEETFSLSFAVRKDSPELLGILNKGLLGMSEAEKNQIYDNWFKLDVQTVTDYSLLWKSTLFFMIALILFAVWNRSLRTEIARRKEIENKLLIAQQKAESANRAKSEFLSNMSHEIRTPMNAVIGFAELTAKMDLPRVAQQNIQTILRSAKALIAIINDILDLSKIEAGKLKVQKEPIDIRELADELQNIFYVKVQEKGLDFIIDFSDNIPNALFIDEIRIRQILLNLVGNAIKFTEKGQIHITFRAIANPTRDSTMDLHISVKDTGIGVNKEDREKVFELFEQQSGQDNRKFGGTGLGLAISQKLAHLLGGEIILVSPEEGGSIFTLILYHVEIASANPKIGKSEIATKHFEKHLVLAVDDIEDNLTLISTLLESYGFEVLSCNDGEKSIEIAKARQPKLIFMDIKMPNMDGYEVTDILKHDEETKSIPVIAVSASVIGEREEAMRRGLFDAFVSKPINTRELEDAIALFVGYTNLGTTNVSETTNIIDYALHMPYSEKVTFIEYLETSLKQGNLNAISEAITKMASKKSLDPNALENLNHALLSFDLHEIESIIGKIIAHSKEGVSHV